MRQCTSFLSAYPIPPAAADGCCGTHGNDTWRCFQPGHRFETVQTSGKKLEAITSYHIYHANGRNLPWVSLSVLPRKSTKSSKVLIFPLCSVNRNGHMSSKHYTLALGVFVCSWATGVHPPGHCEAVGCQYLKYPAGFVWKSGAPKSHGLSWSILVSHSLS